MNKILIVCGIAGMIGVVIFAYISNFHLYKAFETADSEQWNKVYILLMGFGSLGLFLAGIFKKR